LQTLNSNYYYYQMKIITNHHYRPILHWDELTESEQDLRYGIYDGIEESSFFEYRHCLYDLNDFMCNTDNSPFSSDWDGYHNDSFFSAVLVKLDDSGDSVKVGLALS